MTINAAVLALSQQPMRLTSRERARIARQSIPPTSRRKRRLRVDAAMAHSQSYATRFGNGITSLRLWVDRVLSGPVGDMPCESERAAAAEWLMEPLS